MAAAELFVAKLLMDIAVSSAVDVVTRRTSNPTVVSAGRSYNVFSLVSAAKDMHDAYRIASYSEVAGILVREVVVTGVSKDIANVLTRRDGINFEVLRIAEGYLAKGDFGTDSEPFISNFVGWSFFDNDWVEQDYDSGGGYLVERVLPRVQRAFDAAKIAKDAANRHESERLRKLRAWDWPSPLERLNTRLGNVLWVPEPEIGLGSGSMSGGATYRGIYRRNDPDGYGRILWPSGACFFGQLKEGLSNAFGVNRGPDGSIYVGSRSLGSNIGASIDKDLRMLSFGQFRKGKLSDYGRRVDLKSLGSGITGLWSDAKVDEMLTSASTRRRIAKEYRGDPDVAARFERGARNAEEVQAAHDTRIGSLMLKIVRDLFPLAG
jgi:hypothetical protein